MALPLGAYGQVAAAHQPNYITRGILVHGQHEHQPSKVRGEGGECVLCVHAHVL